MKDEKQCVECRFIGEACECDFTHPGDWKECEACGGDGIGGHDCGEDTCCCLRPEPNTDCYQCEGLGGWYIREQSKQERDR